MTQQEAKDYDRLYQACGIYESLRRQYREIVQFRGGQHRALMQFAQRPSDVQRLRYAVSVFEELIGTDWYERK
jgi:hypothetical protein